MTVNEILKKLTSLENSENIVGMKHFGITAKKAFGIPAPVLKELAKDIKKQAENRHELALGLWETEYQEARILAYLIDNPQEVSAKQMDAWANDFDNWAICDGACGHLFCKTQFAYEKAFEWAESEREFVKRAGLVLPAWLAVHDKKATDEKIAGFLPLLEKHVGDERNFIKKAVNWSLRQIGKRNLYLNKLAVETAENIKLQNTKSARWIATDALRELRSEKVLEKLTEKSENSGKKARKIGK